MVKPYEPPLVRIQSDLAAYGEALPLASGATELREADVAPLVEHARAVARDSFREKFAPKVNADDAIRQREHEKDVADRASIEDRGRLAGARAREEEERLAAVPPHGAEPAVSDTILYASAAGIGVSVAPAFHDLLPDLGDPVAEWGVAGVVGIFLGVGVAWGIARGAHVTGDRSKVGALGLVGGLVLGAGILLVRLATAEGALEYLVALGLSAVEVSAVLVLEGITRGVRAAHGEWFAKKDGYEKATRQRDAAYAQRNRCGEELRLLEERIASHLHYVQDRTFRNASIADLENACIHAAKEGYVRGLAKNRGRLLGVGRAS